MSGNFEREDILKTTVEIISHITFLGSQHSVGVVDISCNHNARAIQCTTSVNGSSAGSSYRMGGTTYYNNPHCSSAGTAGRTGNTTYYNNVNGSSVGSATAIGR